MNLAWAVLCSSHQRGWHLRVGVIRVSGLGPGGQTTPVRPSNSPEGQETCALGMGGFSGSSGTKRTARKVWSLLQVPGAPGDRAAHPAPRTWCPARGRAHSERPGLGYELEHQQLLAAVVNLLPCCTYLLETFSNIVLKCELCLC